MNCQYLMYKHMRKQTPYKKYIARKQQIQQKKQRMETYQEILKFKESRYPHQLMVQLQRQINPFQLSLQRLKQVYNSKFPQYSNQLVHEAVQFVFKRKCKQSEMIRQSPIFIQYGDQQIRNGRKLQKQDFSYFFDRALPTSRLDTTRNQPTDRQPQDSLNLNSKLYQEIQAKTDRFNRMLMEAINTQRDKFQNIQPIEEGNPKDSLFYKPPSSKREPDQSFPRFKENDLLVRLDNGLDTGRSDIQQLNQLLGGLTMREEEQGGQVTGRSRGSSYAVKINKDVMDNLYNARGKLKIDLVKRVVDKMKMHY